MGVVWRAHDRHLGATVAIKIARPGIGLDQARFAREIEILRRTSHPGIVRYVGHGSTSDGAPWVAMEWLEGEDLSQRLARDPLGIAETVRLGVALARALTALHAAGFSHCDLKPGNVRLVGGDAFRARLVDFGVAARLSDAARGIDLGEPGVIVGTPSYMAPEQVRGEPTDERSDLFSLGCVLYASLTGAPPFRASTQMGTLAKVLFEERRGLSRVRPDCPPELERLVGQLLEKDRTRRPRTAEDVIASLESSWLEAKADPGDVAERAARGSGSDEVVGSLRGDSHAGAFGARERRWVCVLVARGEVSPGGASLVEASAGSSQDEERTVVDRWSELTRAVAEGGVRVESLRDVARVFVWSSEGSATELARRAAREALRIRSMLDGVELALAAGRVSTDDAFPVGDAVDRAAACLDGSVEAIAVDAGLAQLLADGFELRAEGDRCSLVAERSRPAGTLSPEGRRDGLVGREADLARLRATFDGVVRDGRAAAVVITGEVGIGKSALLRAWIEEIASTPPEVRVWSAQGDPMRQRAAWSVAAELVRSACALPTRASREAMEAGVERAVAELEPRANRARLATSLRALCGRRGGPASPGDEVLVDPIAVGDATREAWETLLVAACERGPVILALDDLQWVDEATIALLDRALRNVGDRPWLLVALGWPECVEGRATPWSLRGVRTWTVGPIDLESARRIARSALGGSDDDPRIEPLLALSGGNPFNLRERLRAAIEGTEGGTPETILAIVEGRLLRLPATDRRVLRAASVFGSEFDAAALRVVLDEPVPEATLGMLVERDWLSVTSRGAYAFRSALVREAAYATIVDDDRGVAHERAAVALTAAADIDAAAIAEHYARSSNPSRSAPWWGRAAQRALEANDFRAAVAHATAAERAGASGGELVDAHLVRAEACMWLGEPLRQLEAAEAALAVCEPSADREAAALRWEANASFRLGLVERASSTIERVGALLDRHGVSASVVEAALTVACNGIQGASPRDASALGARALLFGAAIEEPAVRVRARAAEWRALKSHFDQEPYDRLVAHLSEAAARYEEAGLVRTATAMRGNAGYALTLLGAFEEAELALRAALAESERLGLPDLVASVMQNLGTALAGLGRYDEALRVERQAIALFVEQGSPRKECAARVYASRIALAAGLVDEAVAEAERASRTLSPLLPATMLARAALASALLRRGGEGDGAAALDHARVAREALRRDAAPYTTPILLLSASLDALEANGRPEEAARERAEARAWVLERAAKIESERYRRTFLHAEPDNARILGHR
jgi:tetratricopeptide (TPR) repeat protein